MRSRDPPLEMTGVQCEVRRVRMPPSVKFSMSDTHEERLHVADNDETVPPESPTMRNDTPIPRGAAR